MKTESVKYIKNDKTYLSTLEYERPKEYFKLIVNMIRDGYGDKDISLLDVGCASGAFLYYAFKKLNISKCVGIDVSDELIAQARKYLPDVNFYIDSIDNLKNIANEKFDICTCLGTLCIFDEIESPFRDLLSCLKKGGTLLIFDAFNEDAVDVRMRYRLTGNGKSSNWQTALNINSAKTYEDLLAKYNDGGSHKWIDFKMPFSIPKGDNPMRAWTMKTEKREHQIVVGTGQMLDQKILQIIKS